MIDPRRYSIIREVLYESDDSTDDSELLCFK